MFDTTVIICAHNPRVDHLARVVEALRAQKLSLDQWELIIVDNASHTAISSTTDLSWHPSARHVVESELGLSWARRRGIREACSDLLVFVDDDNILDEDFLEVAVKIGREWPVLGVWGSGTIRGELEVALPPTLQKHRSWLPVRERSTPLWSNFVINEEAIPIGAGLCVRREIALAYCEHCEHSSLQIVGRQGNALTGYEEFEISLLSCRLGFGIGIFPQLGLTHLISKHRLTPTYFVRFAEGTCYSHLLFRYKWENVWPQSPYGWRTAISALKTMAVYRGVDRAIRFAHLRALIKADRAIRTHLRQRKAEERSTIRSAPRVGVGAS